MIGATELQLDDGPRSSLSIGLGFGRYSGISSKFARRFAEGIGKLAGNTPGDHWKKTRRLVARIAEAVGLAGVQAGIQKVVGTTFAEILTGKPPVSGRCTVATQVFERLTVADLLSLGG
ncbi:hypothetical protein BHE74_00032164 [Ensete ventricosum]|nr:hypothetical protein BHE74_00032164 [Ensete ventricosum]